MDGEVEEWVVLQLVRTNEVLVCGRVEYELPQSAVRHVTDAMIALEGKDALEGTLYAVARASDWDRMCEYGEMEETEEGTWVKTDLFDA